MAGSTGTRIAGVIVAGGKSTRMMGRDKKQLRLGGETLLEIAARIVRPQVGALALNLRSEEQRPSAPSPAHGMPVLHDPFAGEIGPLGGVLAGLKWLASLDAAYGWLLTVPGDAPFLPGDLVAALAQSRTEGSSRPVVAHDGDRLQSLCALWPRTSLARLEEGIADGRFRSVHWTLSALDAIACPVRGDFFNINTPEDFAAAEKRMAHSRNLA